MAMAVIVCVTFAACGSDDDDTTGGSGDNGGGNTTANSVLFINDTNYGLLPYAWFMDWGGGEGSFIIANQNTILNGVDQNSDYTYVAVRIPYTTGSDIPIKSFSDTADLDFDLNRIYAQNTVDMTGWSLNQSMTINKTGDKYIVDVYTNDLHIFKSDEESGDGQHGTLKIHYEGPLEIYSLGLGQ